MEIMVGGRRAGFYFGVSGLLGWPRRWKIRFSSLAFPEWVLLQGATLEVDMICKGQPVLADYRSMKVR